MLSPNTRLRYLEELRPPVGYQLDRAIATTFSLDLLTLLIAPLSMVLFEAENAEDALKDPTAVLESLRRTTDRLSVFCQEGRIAAPTKQHLLYSYLESMVVEVKPGGQGVFHPKSWLLRFASKEDPNGVYYRFLCLSRNLTFDQSWDTLIRLEGPLTSRKNAFSRNHPLGDFYRALPKLARNSSPRIQNDIKMMEYEVRRVDFEMPDHIGDITFHPSGIAGYAGAPSLTPHSRLLVVSPFLKKNTLQPLLSGYDNILIARPEELDLLPEDFRTELAQTTSVFGMHQRAEIPEGAESVQAETTDSANTELSGLHAKIYIQENGWDASVYMGSANATNAAWWGSNVELLVGLHGRRKRMGIDAFLGDEHNPNGFRRLLQTYDLAGDTVDRDSTQKTLEEQLELARRSLASIELAACVAETEREDFDLCLQGKEAESYKDALAGCTIWCHPVTLSREDAIDLQPLLAGKALKFLLSLPSLSSFFTFHIAAELEGTQRSLSFTRNIPTSGIPEERLSHVLRSIIGDKSRFLRYLLFLLADDPEQVVIEGMFQASAHTTSNQDRASAAGMPLFEDMVRAFSRHPEKLRRVERLVKELQADGVGDDIFPEGFTALWSAFVEAGENTK